MVASTLPRRFGARGGAHPCVTAALQSATVCPKREQIENVRMTAEQNVLPRALSLAVHELRTPVTVVAGYLRMLLREQAGPLNDKQKKMLEEADRSCGRLTAIVAEMSELGKLEGREVAMARQEFDVCGLAAELASGMHEGQDRGVTLEVRTSSPRSEERRVGNEGRSARRGTEKE